MPQSIIRAKTMNNLFILTNCVWYSIVFKVIFSVFTRIYIVGQIYSSTITTCIINCKKINCQKPIRNSFSKVLVRTKLTYSKNVNIKSCQKHMFNCFKYLQNHVKLSFLTPKKDYFYVFSVPLFDN